MYSVALVYRDKVYCVNVQENDTVSFGSGKKDSVQVPDLAENQILVDIRDETVKISAKPPFRSSSIQLGTQYSIGSGAMLYSSRATGMARTRVALPHNGHIRVGRRPANDVCIALPFVSGEHFMLDISEGVVRVTDLDSTNGLYLNGKKIRSSTLRSGDVLRILTVGICLTNNELTFHNVGSSLSFGKDRQSRPQSSQPSPSPRQAAKPADRQNETRFRLSPRIQERLPQEPIILDRPPKKGQEFHPTGSRIASMLSMGAMAGAGLAMGSISPALGFARAISMAGSVYNMAAGYKMEKKRKEEMEEYNRRRDVEYRTYIEAQKARILSTANEQRRIIGQENPTPQDCLTMARKLDRRLWERMPADRDFLDVRLGMGYEDLCVPIKNYAENRGLMMEDDELENLCNSIAEENKVVDYVPARLPLRTTPTVGIVGDRDRAVHLVRNMLTCLCTQHSGREVHVVGIFDNSERSRWAALRWLPHVWSDNRQYRYLSFDPKRAHNLCEMLYDTLKRRRESAKDPLGGKAPAPLPHYVIILGSREQVQNEPLLELLSSAGPELGVSSVFLFDDLYELPRECGYFIDLNEEHPSAYERHSGNERFVFSRDPAISSVEFDAFARRLASVQLENDHLSSSLPSSVTFLEGMGVHTVDELNVLEHWQKNQVTDSLAAPIGVLASGKPFCLDIHYKAHGAHGLLAGTTGSGKSELLRSWILSMALQYHPHQVNFVVIDYKGGGMANKLEALPHVVGKLTNIDSNISRSLVYLKQEAKHRMKLLESYPGVDDIDQYMQLYYSGKAQQPMPHLIIVSDEFAELKKEEPEFMKELSSLARVGRSVGIHLVLATQRPAGLVDDQIDSNSRFRICMKVNSIQDSKDVLKHPDAAGITQRGRAYVRIGEDEMFDLFQSYWSGAEYVGGNTLAEQRTNRVSIVDVSGERIQPGQTEKKQEIGTDQLTAIVNYVVEQANLARIPRLPGPWKPELPVMLPMEAILGGAAFTGNDWKAAESRLRVPVGLFDRPARQEQDIQYLNFTAVPHYGIYGAPASGKTTLLKTMTLSLGLHFAPEDVQIYIFDFGGRSMSIFEEMPHTAAVVQENEEERLWACVSAIHNEMDRRKRLFEQCHVAGFSQYRRSHRDLPALFVIIDNLQRMNTIYEEIGDFLNEVSMSGSDCGVHLVFTTNNVNKVNMNLRTNIGGSIALRMTDRNDYSVAITEFPEGCRAPANPGRAIIRDTDAAEVQIAYLSEGRADEEYNRDLQKWIGQMKACRPEKISPAAAAPAKEPASVKNTGTVRQSIRTEKTVRDAAAGEQPAKQLAYTRPDQLPLGTDPITQQPCYMDLSEKYTMLISAATEAICSTAVKNLAALLRSRSENRLYVLDGGGSPAAAEVRESRHYARQKDQMDKLVQELYREMEERENALYNGTESFSTQLCLIITGMHTVMEMISDENRDVLLGLCRNSSGLGLIVIAADCIEDLRSYMYIEELTMTLIDYPQMGEAAAAANWQKGLCLGGKPGDHDYFVQTMLPEKTRYKPLAEHEAVAFDCGRAVRIGRSI